LRSADLLSTVAGSRQNTNIYCAVRGNAVPADEGVPLAIPRTAVTINTDCVDSLVYSRPCVYEDRCLLADLPVHIIAILDTSQ